MSSENKLIYSGEACRMIRNSKEDNPYAGTMAETVWKLAHDSCLSCVEACATLKAVPLCDIYRVIAGHSNYHGDNILSALTCITEGKEVKPVKPLPPVDAVEVIHGRWIWKDEKCFCSACKEQGEPKFVYPDGTVDEYPYCHNCGAKMDGGVEND